MMIRQWTLIAAALVLAGIARADELCAPDQDMTFVCGPANAEDLVWVPGTDWILASGMAGETTAGHLYLLDPEARRYEALYPAAAASHRWDRSTFADCPGEPIAAQFSAHGLSLLPGSDGLHRLYVTGHGAREAVEIFEIDSRTPKPTVTWVGCVPMPEHASINSVAALADGGFVTTRISSEDPDAWADIIGGEISGFLLEWHPGGQIRRVPGTDMSGPNGIVASRDGQTIWVASWGRSEISRFVRTADGNVSHDRTMPLGFRPDNLRWTDTGAMLAVGHRLSEKQDCGRFLCFDEWEVAEVDPRAMTATTLAVQRPIEGFNGATAAIRDGAGLWLGTFDGDRIAHIDTRR